MKTYAQNIREIQKARDRIKESFEKLIRMAINGNYETRIDALEALDDSQLDLEPQVRRAMRDRSDLVRATAVEIAGGHDLTSLSDELIRGLISDQSSLVRSASAVALAEMHIIKARNVLKKQLTVCEEEERFPIYYSLAKLGYNQYLKPLLKALTHDSYLIRFTTAHLLPGVVSEQNVKLVRKSISGALKRESTVLVRSSLQEALKEIDSMPSKVIGSRRIRPLTPTT